MLAVHTTTMTQVITLVIMMTVTVVTTVPCSQWSQNLQGQARSLGSISPPVTCANGATCGIAHLYRQVRATSSYCTNCWPNQLPQKVFAVSLPLLALVRAGQSQHTTHNVLVQVKVGGVSWCTILGEHGCSLCYLSLLCLLLGMSAAQEEGLPDNQ